MTPRELRDALLDAGWKTPLGERYANLRKGSAFARLDWDGAEEWYWRGDIELSGGGECQVVWGSLNPDGSWAPRGWSLPDNFHELIDLVTEMNAFAERGEPL